MASRSIVLSEQLETFLASSIEEGRYSDANEAVHEGLRLLEQRDAEERAKVEWLQAAVQEGIDSLDRGEGKSFASMDEMVEYIRGLAREVSAKVAAGVEGD